MQFTPATPALADYLGGFSLLDGAGQTSHHLPAGNPKLCLVLGQEAGLDRGHGAGVPLPKLALFGPQFCAHKLHRQDETRLLVIELKPSGWWALTRQSAALFVNRIADARMVLPDLAPALDIEALQSASLPEIAARAEAALHPWLINAPPRNIWLVHAVQHWLAASTNPQIGDLLRQTGLSPSQAQRHLKALFGGPPKLLARRHRALQAAAALATGNAQAGDALGDGFYDQSHGIRELKQFTGLTPSQIRKSCRLSPNDLPKVEG